MNRYVIEGLIVDAASGKHVGLIPSHRSEVGDVLDFASAIGGAERTLRTNGNERIDYPNGGRLDFPRSVDRLRGTAYDVLAISDSDTHRDGAREAIWPALSLGGELIRL